VAVAHERQRARRKDAVELLAAVRVRRLDERAHDAAPDVVLCERRDSRRRRSARGGFVLFVCVLVLVLVVTYKAGKENAIMSLVGKVIKESNGSANPQMVIKLLKELI
jgi:hypothetical protein